MAELNSIRIDQKKCNNGIWVDYEGDIKLLIARKPNPQYQDYLHELISNHPGEISKGNDKDITMQAVAKHILLGWKNLSDDGKPIKYSPKKALELLRDPSLRDLYEFILISAHDREAYRLEATVKQAKN